MNIHKEKSHIISLSVDNILFFKNWVIIYLFLCHFIFFPFLIPYFVYLSMPLSIILQVFLFFFYNGMVSNDLNMLQLI